jgi:hypothetical protein
MDLNNHNDNMDQDIPARKFLPAQSGPIAQFLNGMPDWMSMTPEDINLAVESLPILQKDTFYLESYCRRL